MVEIVVVVRKNNTMTKPELGSGERFKNLSNKVGSDALAAHIGRKKYGSKKMGQLSAKGRRDAKKMEFSKADMVGGGKVASKDVKVNPLSSTPSTSSARLEFNPKLELGGMVSDMRDMGTKKVRSPSMNVHERMDQAVTGKQPGQVSPGVNDPLPPISGDAEANRRRFAGNPELRSMYKMNDIILKAFGLGKAMPYRRNPEPVGTVQDFDRNEAEKKKLINPELQADKPPSIFDTMDLTSKPKVNMAEVNAGRDLGAVHREDREAASAARTRARQESGRINPAFHPRDPRQNQEPTITQPTTPGAEPTATQEPEPETQGRGGFRGALGRLGGWLGRNTRSGRMIQDARGVDPDTGQPYPEGVDQGSYIDRIRPTGVTDWAGPGPNQSRTGQIDSPAPTGQTGNVSGMTRRDPTEEEKRASHGGRGTTRFNTAREIIGLPSRGLGPIYERTGTGGPATPGGTDAAQGEDTTKRTPSPRPKWGSQGKEEDKGIQGIQSTPAGFSSEGGTTYTGPGTDATVHGAPLIGNTGEGRAKNRQLRGSAAHPRTISRAAQRSAGKLPPATIQPQFDPRNTSATQAQPPSPGFMGNVKHRQPKVNASIKMLKMLGMK